MTTGYGISGIGYPLTGLGNYGLGATSQYASYDNYMLGLNGMGGMNGMNGSIFGMNPMYGMYNPLFMGKMYAQMEQNQLAHASNMHSNLLNNQVRATAETNRAQINTMLVDASIQRGIDNLRQKVVEGDQDGICQEFDKLKNQVYKTYGDEILARGTEESPSAAATRMIENFYGSIVSAQVGEPVNLRTDIEKYGKGAGSTGFMQGLRKGHHRRYVDETLYHCFGTQIDNKGSKDFSRNLGRVGGGIASFVEKGVVGLGIGSGLYALGIGITKGLAALIGQGSHIKWNNKWLGGIAAAGAVIGMVGDVIWGIADRDDNRATA